MYCGNLVTSFKFIKIIADIYIYINSMITLETNLPVVTRYCYKNTST